MTVYKLNLNDEKSKVILLGNDIIIKHLTSPSLHIDGISLEATD